VNTPVLATSRSGVQVFGIDQNGNVQTASYGGTGSNVKWVNIGGAASAENAKPAVVQYPGFRYGVFIRTADGRIMSKVQREEGKWPAEWQPVGSFIATGSPAAILDPVLGRMVVVARGADKQIYVAVETAQVSGVWGDWQLALGGVDSDTPAADPTVAPVTNGSGATWLIVFRNGTGLVRVYQRKLNATAQAQAAPVAAIPFNAFNLPAQK
jgi:hypothetical protein